MCKEFFFSLAWPALIALFNHDFVWQYNLCIVTFITNLLFHTRARRLAAIRVLACRESPQNNSHCLHLKCITFMYMGEASNGILQEQIKSYRQLTLGKQKLKMHQESCVIKVFHVHSVDAML